MYDKMYEATKELKIILTMMIVFMGGVVVLFTFLALDISQSVHENNKLLTRDMHAQCEELVTFEMDWDVIHSSKPYTCPKHSQQTCEVN